MQENAEKITGKVTPFGMEQVLQEKYARTVEGYERFIEDSEKDLKEAELEADSLKKELMKE